MGSHVSSITSSQDMHFKLKKQVMSEKVSLIKFQNVKTKSLISIFKIVF